MMAANPFDQFDAPAAPPPRTLPRVIEGPPREPPPQTEADIQGDQLRNVRTQQEIDAGAHAPETAAANAHKAQIEADNASQSHGSESERTAGFLASRLSVAVDQIGRVDPNAQSTPSVAAGAAGVFGQTARNLANTPDRRRIEGAQIDALDAALTLGTGAAYTREQLEGYRQSYFPAIGDDPATLSDKRERLQGLLLAARVKAGAAAGQVDEVLGKLGFPPQELSGGTATGDAGSREVSPVEAAGIAVNGPQQPGVRVDIETRPDARMKDPQFVAGLDALMNDPTKNGDDIRAYWQGHGGLPSTGGGDPMEPGSRALADTYRQFEGPTSTSVQQGAAMQGSDEAAGIGYSLGRSIRAPFDSSVDFDPAGDYRRGRDAERILQQEAATRSGGGLAQLAGSVAGLRGGAAPYGLGGAVRQGIVGGGMAGAVNGYFSGNGAKDSVADATLGGMAGAAVGYGAGKLSDRLATAFPRPANVPPPPGGQRAQNVARAADAEGVPVSRPIVDPGSRDKMAFLESTIGTGNIVRDSLEGTRAGIEARAGQLGARGTAQDSGTLGTRLQDAGVRFIDRSRTLGGRMYTRAAQMAGNAQVQGQDAVRTLDSNIAELSQNANANAPLIKYLQEIRGDFVDDQGNLVPKTIGAIRDLRTGLRGQINTRNLTATDAERRVGQVLDAARGDITRDLGQTAPAAVRQYQRADRFWAQRQDEIKQVVQRVIGRKDDRLSGEQVMTRLRAMAGPNGDSGRLNRLYDKFSPEERNDIASTIAETIGQKAADEPFTPGQFLLRTRALSDDARKLIFGADGARSIENLRTVSRALTDTQSRLNNSRSGVVSNWRNFYRDFIGGGTAGTVVGTLAGGLPGGVVGAAGGSALSGVGLAARRMSARALMNPDISRWLAAGTRMNSAQQINAHIGQLSAIAGRNPAIAQDIAGLQQRLQQAFGSTPLSAAAGEENKPENARQEPVNQRQPQ